MGIRKNLPSPDRNPLTKKNKLNQHPSISLTEFTEKMLRRRSKRVTRHIPIFRVDEVDPLSCKQLVFNFSGGL